MAYTFTLNRKAVGFASGILRLFHYFIHLQKGVNSYAMELSNGKNGKYTCRSVGLGTGYGCTSEGIPQSDIHDAVITLIRTYAQYSIDLERLQSLQNERRRATQKQAKKDLAVF